MSGGVHILASYRFESGGSLQIIIGGSVDILEAIAMAETLLTLKRKEIAKRPINGAEPKS